MYANHSGRHFGNSNIVCKSENVVIYNDVHSYASSRKVSIADSSVFRDAGKHLCIHRTRYYIQRSCNDMCVGISSLIEP